MAKWFGFCCHLFLVYAYIRPHFCFVQPILCLSRTHVLPKEKTFLWPCQGVWLNLRQLKCIFQPEKSDGCRLLGTIICLAHGLGWCTEQITCLPSMRFWSDSGINVTCGWSLLVLYSVLWDLSLSDAAIFSSPQKPKLDLICCDYWF